MGLFNHVDNFEHALSFALASRVPYSFSQCGKLGSLMVNGDGFSKHANQRVEFRTCQSCPAILNIEQCIVLA